MSHPEKSEISGSGDNKGDNIPDDGGGGIMADQVIVPPFAGVALVEVRDRIELTPYCWCREFIGMGKRDPAPFAPSRDSFFRPIFDAFMRGRQVWVVVVWRQFEDGTEEAVRAHVLDAEATEKQARETFDHEISFTSMGREELEAITSLYAATDDDLEYIESRFPKFLAEPNASLEEKDLYQARLKVLAGLQPNTVAQIMRADAATNTTERERIEREAVAAYFADMAHYWTDEMMREWQKRNPVGTEWLLQFARVRSEPRRSLDGINYELVLNWLRQKYNLLTAEELSAAIDKATGQKIKPATIKKRRERLGLTTKRPPGPRPRSEE